MSEHQDPRPRDDTDAVKDITRDLADIAHQISTFKGGTNAYLKDPNYETLRSGWRTPTLRSRLRLWRRGGGCG
jgi:hypothetical protein